MAELDLRKNYLHQPGWPINNLSLEEMVYRLITVIGSSQFLYDNFNEDEYFFNRMKQMEMEKVSELLVTIAVICRAALDELKNNLCQSEIQKNVGILKINGKNNLLTFRESCNKIIHAIDINFDIKRGDSLRSGFLNHFIYLYGNRDDINWKAEIDLVSFCKSAGWVM